MALYFHSGIHEDTHSPADTTAKINDAGEAAVVDVVARVIVAISQQPELKFVAATTQPTSTTRPLP